MFYFLYSNNDLTANDTRFQFSYSGNKYGYKDSSNNFVPFEDSSDATATAAQILSGFTAYSKGQKLTGNIAQRSASSINISSTKTYYSGYYPNNWTVTPSSVPMEIWYIPSNGYAAMITNAGNKSYKLSTNYGETIDLTTRSDWVTNPVVKSIRYNGSTGQGSLYYEFDRKPNFAFWWNSNNGYGGGFEGASTASNRINQTSVGYSYVFAHVFIFIQS